MAGRYIVAPGHEFNYPSEADDKVIKAAGGRSKMKSEDLRRIHFKTVTSGQDCSDMPHEARELYVSRGWILVEPTHETPKEVE
jgi:hypothetical protein